MSHTTIDSSAIREIYDQWAHRYDRREALAELVLLRRYRRHLLASAHGRVLEVGIGTGRNLRYYPPDCQIIGIDISENMLKIAERRATQLQLDVKLLPMDAHELAFPDRSFDTIVSSFSLCTMTDPVRVLTEMSRVSALNGRILLLEHGRSRYRWVSWLLDRMTPYHVSRYGCHPNRNIGALVQAADLITLQAERHLLGGILHVIRARPPRSATLSK